MGRSLLTPADDMNALPLQAPAARRASMGPPSRRVQRPGGRRNATRPAFHLRRPGCEGLAERRLRRSRMQSNAAVFPFPSPSEKSRKTKTKKKKKPPPPPRTPPAPTDAAVPACVGQAGSLVHVRGVAFQAAAMPLCPMDTPSLARSAGARFAQLGPKPRSHGRGTGPAPPR